MSISLLTSLQSLKRFQTLVAKSLIKIIDKRIIYYDINLDVDNVNAIKIKKSSQWNKINVCLNIGLLFDATPVKSRSWFQNMKLKYYYIYS